QYALLTLPPTMYLISSPPTLPLLPLTFHFSFPATATTEIYTLSLHDALPIFRTWLGAESVLVYGSSGRNGYTGTYRVYRHFDCRSEEHTSELQSRFDLVCRLLLEKKKKLRKQKRMRRDESVQDESVNKTWGCE